MDFNRIDIEVKDNKITALTWDAVQEDGTGKEKCLLAASIL